MKRALMIVVHSLLMVPGFLFADSLSFEELWQKVESHSLGRQAKQLEYKASEVAKERSDRHWLPRVYTDVRAYNTNDPALNLLGKLGQRSATDADFSTASARVRPGNFLDSNNQPYNTLNSDTANLFAKDTLNNPGSNTYSRGSLGIDLPVYEGGASQTLSKIQEKRSIGIKFEKEALRDREFANLALYYRGLQSIAEYKTRLEQISKTESRFQSGYQLANKSNPVGYSGYLALKSLKNRLDAMSKESSNQLLEFKENLSLLSGMEAEQIQTISADLFPFVDTHFPKLGEKGDSNYTKALSIYTETEGLKSEMEMSKFLPRVGVYSEANAYSGSRSTQTAYNAGFYVQMNLYNPKDMGAVEEAKLQAEAMRKRLEETRNKEEAFVKTLTNQEVALRENYLLIKDSLKNQEEQVVYMQRLFQSGAVNAIQFAEVLNRSIDVAKSMLDIELNYIRVRSELHLIQKGNSNEPASTN
ncbi:transporter [Leptospira ognonensis]|uniref:Transporter n=1 Tax=Leptospira ognonensis TaxID=2484945 RepID=A0A4R9JZL7_9LEPT|nr:TolC family protein [Leptospira ognonensis]TGL57078.1 transporter [Leptospira ognonensis]